MSLANRQEEKTLNRLCVSGLLGINSLQPDYFRALTLPCNCNQGNISKATTNLKLTACGNNQTQFHSIHEGRNSWNNNNRPIKSAMAF